MKNRASILFITGVVLGIVLSAYSFQVVFAKKTLGDAAVGLNTVSQKTGITEKEVTNIVGNGIEAALGVVGLLFFILMVYAGITWMLARGSEEEVTKARNIIIAATIGLLITVSGYAITRFVTTAVIQGETANPLTDPTNGQVPVDTGGPKGCCVSWTKPTLFAPSIASWKLMTKGSCQFVNESVEFDPSNQNKIDGSNCSGEGKNCWLFFEGLDEQQCKVKYEENN